VPRRTHPRRDRAQVAWDRLADASKVPRVPAGGGAISDVLLHARASPTERVKVQPVQFHFHEVSEHSVDGALVRAALAAAAACRSAAFVANCRVRCSQPVEFAGSAHAAPRGASRPCTNGTRLHRL
jgi:hypothetical protein